MFLRSGFEYNFSAPTSITSARRSKKRKSVDDDLDERPLKRQNTTLILQGEPPSSSHPATPVAPPSTSNPPSPVAPPFSSNPPSRSSSPVSEIPFVREDSCVSDGTVAIDDGNSSDGTAPLEDKVTGNEMCPRRVHFDGSVIEYLFQADDEPCRVVEARHFAYLCDAE